MANEYTLKIDGVEVTDYDNIVVNGVSYKLKKAEESNFVLNDDSTLTTSDDLIFITKESE